MKYPNDHTDHVHRSEWGGGGKRRFFKRGEFKFAMLELLATKQMHGYQLIKAMEERTGGLYAPSPGSVYPNLQLLEDMGLIGSSETNGKKLYHITDEGHAYLRKKGNEDDARPDNRWDHHGRHRSRRESGFSKHSLRSLMRECPEVIHVMALAAEVAHEHPSSKQAAQFRELMADFQESLKEIVTPLESSDERTTN